MSVFTAFAKDVPRLETSKVEAINRYVIAEMARQRIPGLALGIYKNGVAVLAAGYGMANVELNVPMTAESVLQSGSVGKSFTATAVMMLVEQGQIKLDDSIRNYFPEAPASWEAVKIAHLLSHTSGLSAYDTLELQNRECPLICAVIFQKMRWWQKLPDCRLILIQAKTGPMKTRILYCSASLSIVLPGTL